MFKGELCVFTILILQNTIIIKITQDVSLACDKENSHPASDTAPPAGLMSVVLLPAIK